MPLILILEFFTSRLKAELSFHGARSRKSQSLGASDTHSVLFFHSRLKAELSFQGARSRKSQSLDASDTQSDVF